MIWHGVLGREIAEYTNTSNILYNSLSSYFIEFFWKTGLLILAFKYDIYGHVFSRPWLLCIDNCMNKCNSSATKSVLPCKHNFNVRSILIGLFFIYFWSIFFCLRRVSLEVKFIRKVCALFRCTFVCIFIYTRFLPEPQFS